LLGKLVGLTLQKEGRVDESLVIHPQSLLDAGLRLSQGPLRQRLPRSILNQKIASIYRCPFPGRWSLIPSPRFLATILQYVKLQYGRLVARFGALDAIDVALIAKYEGYLRRIAPRVDQRVIPLARLAE
jgi:hypothetical protein